MVPTSFLASRRQFLGSTAAGVLLGSRLACPQSSAAEESAAPKSRRFLKSLKWDMIQEPGLSLEDTFAMLKEIGFDGVELNTPSELDFAAARRASGNTGLAIDGSVDSKHWEVRMTDPVASVRDQALQDLLTALQDTHTAGGHSVLLVPGLGTDGTKPETWDRAVEQIERALPLAAKLGVHILIENVWNHMFYDHEGSNAQTADELVTFVDRLNSPWVGVQFDVGNHKKYSDPAAWIRQLGSRIVKLDIKDWSQSAGFCGLGDGEVDWSTVRTALAEIGFQGWAAAEVAGGNRDQLQDVSQRMDRVLDL